jgi:hypothetical protein
MSTKLLLAAVPLLFLGSAVMAADIVYDNDWRAGETGYIHNRNECSWHHHHTMRRVSGVTYSDSNFDSGVAVDNELAADGTVYDTNYAPENFDRDTRLGVRYDSDREWRDGRRDFERREFRDRDAGVGARVDVGGHDGVGAGARVNDSGVGAGAHVDGHGVGVGVGGDHGIDIHAK